MSETVFSYKTKGGASPENKPKVYFTCHPEDFDKYFESVCNDLFETQDCVIFYTEDMSKDISDENTLVDLERMSLFVIPVTFRLLTTHNRTMILDFAFAKEKHIPVLPLIMESGISGLYSKSENFGELQYLNPYSSDGTAIEYKDKLKRYLESVLISNDLAKRIREAFDAYIFLSYRKKDRKYANELMKLIHKNPECEDIAIWFDEFLTPGESFRENIEKILKDSKLFTLLVTPNLLERKADGSPNFVMREEYPAAKRQGKRILPAEMVYTDKENLTKDYAGIPECANPKDEEDFNKRLSELLVGIAISENNDDPKHNYLIGLAYLKGVDVEIDVDRGLRLIKKAADANLQEAVEKLSFMYREGDSVELDYSKSIYYAEKLYALRVDKYGEDHKSTLDSLNNLSTAYFYHGNYKKAAELFEKCYESSCRVLGEENETAISALNNLALSFLWTGNYKKSIEYQEKSYLIKCKTLGAEHINTLGSLNNLALAYQYNGDFKKSFELQKKCYELRVKTLGEIHPDTLRSLNNMGSLYSLFCDFKKALETHEKCYEMMRKVLGEEQPETTLVSLSNLANDYSRLGNYKEALSLTEKCYKIRCKVLGEEHPDTLKNLRSIADVYELLGEYQQALELYNKCYESMSRSLGGEHPDTLESLCYIAYMYELLHDYKKSLELYKKCYEIRRRVLGEEHVDTVMTINGLANAYDGLGDTEKSIELYEKCYEIYARTLGEEHQATLTVLSNLALTYRSLKQYKKSFELQSKCYEISSRVLGKEHPDTIKYLGRFAIAYYYLGDFKKAFDLLDVCYEISCRVLGKDHPQTINTLKNITSLKRALSKSKMEIIAVKGVTQGKVKNDGYSFEQVKSKLLIAHKKHNYVNLKFCQPTDPEVKKAISQYASGVADKDIIAVVDRTPKLLGFGKAKGVLFAKDAIYSSELGNIGQINYKDVKSVSLSVGGLKFRLKDGKSIDCDFGKENNLILDFLHTII